MASKVRKPEFDAMLLKLDYHNALLKAVYPDEATRRWPGFDISDWRTKKMPTVKKLEAAVKRLDA
jgi:hypothetical protein